MGIGQCHSAAGCVEAGKPEGEYSYECFSLGFKNFVIEVI